MATKYTINSVPQLDGYYDSRRGEYVYTYDYTKDKALQTITREFLESPYSLSVTHSRQDRDGGYVALKDNIHGLIWGVNVWQSGDGICSDWNQDSFSLVIQTDCFRKMVQEDPDFATLAFSIAEEEFLTLQSKTA